jgi:molybdate transport system substrate-binding protein
MRNRTGPTRTSPGGARPWRERVAGAGLFLLLVLTGCGEGGGGEGPGEPLLVLAAASLNEAMPALLERFEARTGESVDLALGSTGSLAAQIENGAPADLFFAADEATVERLAASGSIRPGSVRRYAEGRLALVWRAGAVRPTSLRAVGEARYEVVAIANPEVAPYGAATREALRRVGVWEAVEGRVVQGESVAQAYQLVRTGNADVALVALSVVDTTPTELVPVDPALHAPIRQAAGVLERSVHPAAAELLAFVLSAEGQAILARHGFGAAGR